MFYSVFIFPYGGKYYCFMLTESYSTNTCILPSKNLILNVSTKITKGPFNNTLEINKTDVDKMKDNNSFCLKQFKFQGQ